MNSVDPDQTGFSPTVEEKGEHLTYLCGNKHASVGETRWAACSRMVPFRTPFAPAWQDLDRCWSEVEVDSGGAPPKS